MDSLQNGGSALSDFKRQRTNTSKPKAKASWGSIVPKPLKDSVSVLSGREWLDIALFVGGMYGMYKFGSSFSEQVEGFFPNDEQIAKMA